MQDQSDWQAFGHQNIKRILDAQLRGELPHAYLFCGPSGSGKKALAMEFASKIVGHQPPHVDILLHDLAEQSSVEELRHLLQLASLTPVHSQRKVIVITNMHLANPAINSALLKTLEEPSARTLFLLVADSAQLIPTIMSRCQIMQCNRLSVDELRAYVKEQNLVVSNDQLILAGGSISRLQEIISGSAEVQTLLAELKQLRSALASGDAERMILIQHLAELDDAVLEQLINSWVNEQTGKLAERPENYISIQSALETLNRLRRNANKKMALEYFVTNSKI